MMLICISSFANYRNCRWDKPNAQLRRVTLSNILRILPGGDTNLEKMTAAVLQMFYQAEMNKNRIFPRYLTSPFREVQLVRSPPPKKANNKTSFARYTSLLYLYISKFYPRIVLLCL